MLGKKLIEYRENNKLTIEELAFKIDVPLEEITRWENDEEKPSLEQLIIIADIYNVSLDELIGRKLKTKKKDGYLARTYIKYDDALYNRISVNLFDGTIKGCLILAIICFVLTLISIVFDIQVLRYLSIFFGVLFLFVRSISKKNKVQSISNLKNTNPNLEHYFWFYDNKIELTAISKNGKVNYTIHKSDMSAIKFDDKYIYFIAYGLYFVVDRNMVDGNSDILNELFNLNNKKNNPKTKSSKFILVSLSILSILSIFFSLILLGYKLSTIAIPEFVESVSEFGWVFLVFLPIPIISIIVGFINKDKGRKNYNSIIGLVVVLILALISAFVSIDKNNISHSLEIIEVVENDAKIDLPSEAEVSILHYEECLEYALIRFTGDDVEKFNISLSGSKEFVTVFPYNIDSYYMDLYADCDYYCVYDMDCKTYNERISKEHKEHKRIYLGYDIDTNLLVVVYDNVYWG